MIDPKELEF